MRNSNLKLAVVASGKTHQELARRANEVLPPAEHLSELQLTKFITRRAVPSDLQRKVLSQTLKRPVTKLFPN